MEAKPEGGGAASLGDEEAETSKSPPSVRGGEAAAEREAEEDGTEKRGMPVAAPSCRLTYPLNLSRLRRGCALYVLSLVWLSFASPLVFAFACLMMCARLLRWCDRSRRKCPCAK